MLQKQIIQWGAGHNQVSPFHGPARIYGLINVPSGPGLLCSRAGGDVAAPLGCSVKSTGAEPGHTARMCQCNIQPSVAAAAVAAVGLLTQGQLKQIEY